MSFFVGPTDDVEGFLTHWLAVQEGVDLGIGHAVGGFVGLARCQVFEVGGGDFFHQELRSAEVPGDGPDLVFHQPAQGRQR